MTQKPPIRVGIASPAQVKERLLAAARGEKADLGGVKVWASSIEAFAGLFTPENRELLTILERDKPNSVSALAKLLKRDQGNVSRTLQKLAAVGLVRLVRAGREKRPEIMATRLTIELDILHDSFRVAS
jgi:predicted transcriptional regulator